MHVNSDLSRMTISSGKEEALSQARFALHSKVYEKSHRIAAKLWSENKGQPPLFRVQCPSFANVMPQSFGQDSQCF